MKLFKQLREEHGLTQAELAKNLQISTSTVAMYERGERKPDPDMLIKIADFFNISVDYLLGRTDVKNPSQTIAAHRTDDPKSPLPEEALKAIEDFKKFMYQKHGKKFD